jgi:hypothetical protein
MASLVDPTSHVDAIVALAEEIARVAPDCADRAMKIIELARELDKSLPDRASIEDAIEGQILSDELSEPQVRSVTSAVVSSWKDDS